MKFTYREIKDAIVSGNDARVLNYLYGTLLPKVRNYVVRNSGSKEEADDIFQDAVLILYKRVMEGKMENVDNISGFLFQVSKNLWIDRARLLGKMNSLSNNEANLVSKEKNAIDVILTEEKRMALSELFSMVGEKCYRLMELHLFDKKSMEEIASLMGMPGADSAKAQHYRCKQKLIELIKTRKDINQILN